MNKDEAGRLLSGVRVGVVGDTSPRTITEALRATGDIPALSPAEQNERRVPERAAWVQCKWCPEVWCRIHDQHAHECSCPPVEEWDCDPYTSGAEWPA